MPLSTRELAILALLLISVPLQFYLTTQSQMTREEKSFLLQKMMKKGNLFLNYMLSSTAWLNLLYDIRELFIEDFSRWYPDDKDPFGECPAVEVIRYKSPHGYFATSPHPRKERPKAVIWRVGQAIQHTTFHYRGVIIGWDERCNGSPDWIKSIYGNNDHQKDTPHYAVLVDKRDKRDPQIAYVPQDKITIIKSVIHNTDITQYFDFYDGAQYIPQAWLRAIYPLD